MSSAPNEPEKTDMEPAPMDSSLLDLYQLLDLFIVLLTEQAKRHMGLDVDPRTNEVKKDFAKAHVAIDCIISLVDKIEPQLASSDKDRLRNLITDLQVNYVQQMK